MFQCFSSKYKKFIDKSRDRDYYAFCEVSWCDINILYCQGWNCRSTNHDDSTFFFFINFFRMFEKIMNLRSSILQSFFFPSSSGCFSWQFWATDHRTVNYTLQERHSPWWLELGVSAVREAIDESWRGDCYACCKVCWCDINIVYCLGLNLYGVNLSKLQL